jgi:predicted XRE-type DNA-binding protein
MLAPDIATVQSLRSDVALQIARYTHRLGINQLAAARRLRVPQPTLSKIANGRISDLSLELLIRIAVRAGMPVTLQTGLVPQEAGAFISGSRSPSPRTFPSNLADEARESLKQSERRLTHSQRLEAFLEHNQLLDVLHQAGRLAEAERVRNAPPKR